MYRQVVLFSGFDASRREGLWETNGMAGGTRELAATGGEDNEFTVFNGEVLFVDANSTTLSHSLWVTDGTTAGTHELSGISGAYTGAGGFNPSFLTVFSKPLLHEVLFRATDASGNIGLWASDGTVAGTQELTGITGASSQPYRHGCPSPGAGKC